ncbi:hypothetical protein HanPI659440_Chr08g0292981 [Helianthus annuus]|nr:hypothetical protein HanPI659440_Chr08g0292981 [Helianthus annuus]
MVYASETFGAAPVLVASRITSIGFASHHSPAIIIILDQNGSGEA